MSSNLLAVLGERCTSHILPMNVFLELTYACNEVCSHCYLVNKPFVPRGEKISGKQPPYGELTTGEVLHLLDELAEAQALFLTFTGGEVFVRDDIFELAEAAKKKRFALRFFTNALLIDEPAIAQLKRLKPLEIGVSVYSTKASVHDAITRIPGSFQKTVEAIQKMTQEGLTCSLKCPLMAHTASEVPQFVRLAQRVGARPKFDLSLSPADDGGRSPLFLRIDEESSIQALLEDERIFPKPVGKAKTPEREASDPIMCDAGKALVNISPFGDVFPCIQFRVYSGNIRKESFLDIWNRSKTLLSLRQIQNADFPVCVGCEYRSVCGRCSGVAQLEDGDARGPQSRACRLAKVRWKMSHTPDERYFL